jgi:hypothetical protein
VLCPALAKLGIAVRAANSPTVIPLQANLLIRTESGPLPR